MTEAKSVVNIDNLELTASSKGTRFAVEEAWIGAVLGLRWLGATLHVVPPGKIAFPFHRHHVADEMFLILSGSGAYRIGEEQLPVKVGDCLGAPAGGKAHQIINTGNEPLRYIGFSNNANADVIEYPDTGKIAVSAGASGLRYSDATYDHGGRLEPLDYWEGEDVGEEES